MHRFSFVSRTFFGKCIICACYRFNFGKFSSNQVRHDNIPGICTITILILIMIPIPTILISIQGWDSYSIPISIVLIPILPNRYQYWYLVLVEHFQGRCQNTKCLSLILEKKKNCQNSQFSNIWKRLLTKINLKILFLVKKYLSLTSEKG